MGFAAAPMGGNPFAIGPAPVVQDNGILISYDVNADPLYLTAAAAGVTDPAAGAQPRRKKVIKRIVVRKKGSNEILSERRVEEYIDDPEPVAQPAPRSAVSTGGAGAGAGGRGPRGVQLGRQPSEQGLGLDAPPLQKQGRGILPDCERCLL